MQAAADIDLVQDVTADCSVVASLCAAVARPGGTYGKVCSLADRLAHTKTDFIAT
jgi:hypothetical protein